MSVKCLFITMPSSWLYVPGVQHRVWLLGRQESLQPGAVVRDNPRSSIREFLTGMLENQFNLRFRHGLPDIPMHDVSAKAVQNGTQVVKCPADVDVRNVDMPVFMRFQGLIEAIPFFRWIAVEALQQTRR